MLHFAYGANMSRAVMRRHAREARPLGVASMVDHHFVITADGYASVERALGQPVYGVLWSITPRDRATLDAWENTTAGLYRPAAIEVRGPTGLVRALVYLARPCGEGRAKPGYLELVVAAAKEWNLPEPYVRSLEGWRHARPLGAGSRKLGEFA
jgi:hypothetical protein